MRIPEPPFPSFTWVLTNQENPPVYYSPPFTQRDRLRPYIRQHPPLRRDHHLMKTVDYREEEPIDTAMAPSLPFRAIQERESCILNLQEAINKSNPLDHVKPRLKRLPSLSTLVIDLAVCVKRRYRSIVVRKVVADKHPSGNGHV